jgi:hypothetical protein
VLRQRVIDKPEAHKIDMTGNMVIPPRYDLAEPFSGGLSAVKISPDGPRREGKWGYIRKNGETAIPQIYHNVTPFHEERAFVYKETGWFLIDQTGRFISDEPFETVRDFSAGLAPVRVNRLWGYIDRDGKRNSCRANWHGEEY